MVELSRECRTQSFGCVCTCTVKLSSCNDWLGWLNVMWRNRCTEKGSVGWLYVQLKLSTVLEMLPVCGSVQICMRVFHKSKINSPSLSGTILLSLSSFSLILRFCHTGIVADFRSCSDLTLGCPGLCGFTPTVPGCFFFVCFTFGFDPVGFTFGVTEAAAQHLRQPARPTDLLPGHRPVLKQV